MAVPYPILRRPVQHQPQSRGAALRLAAGRSGGLPRRAGRHVRAVRTAGEAGVGAAGGAAPKDRLNFLSAHLRSACPHGPPTYCR
jgi:hypothetical protein